MVSISAIAILFLLLILILAAQRSLIPGIIVLGSFISFVLWLTGLVGTAMQLYGTGTSVNSVCNTYVTNSPEYGATLDTLAWLTQNNICEFLLPSLSLIPSSFEEAQILDYGR